MIDMVVLLGVEDKEVQHARVRTFTGFATARFP